MLIFMFVRIVSCYCDLFLDRSLFITFTPILFFEQAASLNGFIFEIQLIGYGTGVDSYEPTTMNMHLGSVLILHGGEWKNLKIPYSVSKNTSKFSEIKFTVENLILAFLIESFTNLLPLSLELKELTEKYQLFLELNSPTDLTKVYTPVLF